MNASGPSTPVEHYGQLIDAGRADLPDWLQAMAGAANDAFRAKGFPDRRDENWRYTTLSALLEQPFVPAEPNEAVQPSDIEDLMIPGLDAYRVVLVNGRFEPRLSTLSGLPAGVWVGGFAAAVDRHGERVRAHLGGAREAAAEAFTNLNLAAADDGAVVLVDSGVDVSRAIEIVHVAVGGDEPQLAQPRHLVVLEDGASAELVERYVSLGDSTYFDNVVIELALGESAKLRHYYLQEESAGAYHMRSQYLTQRGGSRYEGLGCTIGASWSRADWHVDFAGRDAGCDLRGLYVVGDGQLADNHLHVHHKVPGCTSREDFRGVLNGRGRGVFDGRIVVHPDAQQTDARLSNNNLMLSRDAEVDTKPQLEIFADDVACSHGTTVGQIEPEQLFYLRSRGIPESQARRMICLGFAQSVLEGITDVSLSAHLGRVVGERLAKEVSV